MPASQNPNPSRLPIDPVTMFSDHKKMYKKGIEKRQTKLLQQVDFLEPFLKENEKIKVITTGCSPMSFVEQLIGGWPALIQKRAVFIFTTHRIFHVPSKMDYTYRHSIAHIPYENCKSIKLKGGTLVVEYGDSGKEKFIHLHQNEKKKIKALLEGGSFSGTPIKAAKRVHLCPRCTHELEKDDYTCSNCKLEFKNKTQGRNLSLIFPGGGYFYTRHPLLGIGDAVTETFLILLCLASLIPDPAATETGSAFFIFFFFLAFEKVISIFHSNHFIKEYIPKDKRILFKQAGSYRIVFPIPEKLEEPVPVRIIEEARFRPGGMD